MNLNEIKQFHSRVSQILSPEELFGELNHPSKEENLHSLNEVYKDLIKKFHPDKFASEDEYTRYLAGQVSGILNELNARAKKKIEKDLYGKDISPSSEEVSFEIKTKSNTYKIFEHFMEADYANLYVGEFIKPVGGLEKVCIKIIKDSADNDLLRNEIKILKSIQHKSIPVFFDEFRTTSGELGLVERFIEGFDFISILEKYPKGLAVEHVCWILERLLSVLGYLHYNKIIHGNIEPGNIIVRPSDHNVFLIDYLFAIPNANTTTETYGCYNEIYSAPEVTLKKKPIPPSDIYSLGKSILFLLGGNVEKNKFPKKLDARLAEFFSEFLESSPIKRPKDAWVLWHRLSNLREEVFGARHQFLELEI
ncbi:MAG: protein kinase [Leptospiraceae bacterium]|nr:protein kinase [Leptospiraceae bacterium]